MALIGSAPDHPFGWRLWDLAKRQALRLATLLRRFQLERELATGVDPRSRPVLAVRAEQLTRRRCRRRLAVSVERLVKEFDANRPWWSSAAIPFLRDQVAEARGTLLFLAYVLRWADRVEPRGLAIVAQLLMDPDRSPLYVPSARGGLQLKAHAALQCLLGERQPWTEIEPAIPPAIYGSWNGHGLTRRRPAAGR